MEEVYRAKMGTHLNASEVLFYHRSISLIKLLNEEPITKTRVDRLGRRYTTDCTSPVSIDRIKKYGTVILTHNTKFRGTAWAYVRVVVPKTPHSKYSYCGNNIICQINEKCLPKESVHEE